VLNFKQVSPDKQNFLQSEMDNTIIIQSGSIETSKTVGTNMMVESTIEKIEDSNRKDIITPNYRLSELNTIPLTSFRFPIKTFTWTPTTMYNRENISFSLPLSSSTLLTLFKQMSQKVRIGILKFTVVVTGCTTCYGRMRVAYMPFAGGFDGYSRLEYSGSSYCLSGVDISPSLGGTYEFVAPWAWPDTDIVDNADIEDLIGNLVTDPIVLLTETTSAPHPRITIYMEFDDIYRYGGQPQSGAVKKLGKATTQLGNAIDNVGDALNMFGMSRPMTNDTVAQALGDPQMSYSGVSYSKHLANTDEVWSGTYFSTGDEPSDLDIKTIGSEWSYLGTFPFNNQDNGDIIKEWDVKPSLAINGVAPFRFNPLCWACAPYTWWRGTVEFKLTAVMSPFARARIRAFHTQAGLVPPIYGDSRLPHAEFDIAESSEIILKCGMIDNRGYDAVRPSAFDGLGNSGNGRVTIVSCGQVTGPSDLPVYFVVHVRCQDLELYRPQNDFVRKVSLNTNTAPDTDSYVNTFDVDTLVTTANYNLLPQSLAMKASSQEFTLSTSNQTDPSALFGPPEKSLNALIKKPSYFMKFRSIDGYNVIGIDHGVFPPLASFNSELPAQFGWQTSYLSYVGMRYSCFRGSVRYLYCPNRSADHNIVNWFSTQTNSNWTLPATLISTSLAPFATESLLSRLSTEGAISCTVNKSTFEIETSQLLNGRLITLPKTWNASSRGRIFTFSTDILSPGESVDTYIFVSAGNNFTLHNRLPIPEFNTWTST
jgi:hypothetical protein